MSSRRLARAPASGALALAAALTAAGCADQGEGPPERRQAVPDEGRGTHTVAPARYRTDVSFVPFASGGRRVHFRFSHVTSTDRLERDYGAWELEGAGAWRPLLAVRDTLPVPRAGWRVLPAPGLGVVAGAGGSLDALVRRDGGDALRLDLGRTVARWESPTGQREQFRLSELVAGGRRLPGLAVERRSALAAEAPAPRGLYGFLLVADSTGQGIVILRHGGTPPGRRPPEVDTTAVAHGWTDDGPRSWREVALDRVDAGSDRDGGRASPPPAGWRVSIPDAGARGRLVPGPVDTLDAGGGTSGGGGDDGRTVRLYGVSGTLTVYGRTRPVRGIGVETGRP